VPHGVIFYNACSEVIRDGWCAYDTLLAQQYVIPVFRCVSLVSGHLRRGLLKCLDLLGFVVDVSFSCRAVKVEAAGIEPHISPLFKQALPKQKSYQSTQIVGISVCCPLRRPAAPRRDRHVLNNSKTNLCIQTVQHACKEFA
jgi:hypothetical protein